jgi:hypothetical protein
MQQYFYDQQIRRFLLQFTRIFSLFEVEYGRDDQGNPTLIRVPVRYGDATRQAQTILQNNSASSMPSTPLMTFYITGMDYDRARLQEPYFVSRFAVRQRTYDTATETYETTQGNAFTIERLMPVPYKMTLNLDIWTSNTNQKMQIFEQIATLFNPSLEVQSTDNYIDWTSLSVVELDQVTWTSRTIPIGTEDPIDIMTMRFNIPIWISSPAKVKKLGVVEKIIASCFDAQGDASEAILNSDLLLGTRQKITPYGYQTLLVGNKIQCLTYSTVINPTNDNTQGQQFVTSNLSWNAVVGMYGVLRPGISQIRLSNPYDDNQVVGFVSFDPLDQRFMLFDVDIDTIPQNTLQAINAIIDPLLSGPNNGLPAPATGQRYLILQDMGQGSGASPTAAWGSVLARANDIIEFDGVEWYVDFDASESANQQFVTNINTGQQYRWTGSTNTAEWVKSYEGLYPGGEWSLVL